MYKRYSPLIGAWAFIILFCSEGQAQEHADFALTPIGSEAFEVLREFYRYDEAIPLDVRTVERVDGPDYSREKIVFRGVRDSRVPAYLAVPKSGDAPYPCVLLVHGIGGSKEGWWTEGSSHSGWTLTQRLLALGYSVLALDCQYHGERLANNDYESSTVFTFERGWFQRTRDMVVQSIVEHRRAIDALASRPDVDASRIGIIGYSMGGMMTFMLAAVEPRIVTAIACVPPLLREPYSPLAIHNSAPRISQPFLMLMGSDDPRNYTTEEAKQLHELIESPVNEMVFYEGGHNLPRDWTERATQWMEAHLKSR